MSARFDSFLRMVVEQKASDLHFSAGAKPTIRYQGELYAIPFRTLSDTETRRFIFEILTPEQKRTFLDTQELDFIYEIPEVGRFRGNVYQHQRGIGSVFRIISTKVPTLDELYLPRSLKRSTKYANGLVLVTGPTGSGKTTTLAALINEVNRNRACHIITIEDPIEYIHQPERSVISQRQVGRHVASFSGALRSALRESPDVLLIGELRDLETINLAVNAAETGVLVFGTLHTTSAPKSIDRIIHAYPEEQADQIRGVLSVTIRCVMAQLLCRRASGEGRVAALEIMFNSVAIANLIRKNQVYQIEANLQQADPRSGSISMDRYLVKLVKNSLLTLNEALKVARSPHNLKRLIAEEEKRQVSLEGALDSDI